MKDNDPVSTAKNSMFCPHCGKRNFFLRLDCRHCGKPIKSQSQLDAELKSMWENLPPEVQKKIERKNASDLERYFRETALARKSLKKHVITIAVVLGLIGLSSGLFILPDILFGALAGYILCKMQGGAFWGIALFSGEYAISLAIKFDMMPAQFLVLTGTFGLILCGIFGRFYGARLEMYYAGTDD
ncbi:MAG: hypothetical protein V1701_11290 [Planctomycetota bacterium]